MAMQPKKKNTPQPAEYDGALETENIHQRLGGKDGSRGNCKLFVQARQCCVCLLWRSLASWLSLHCQRIVIIESLAVWGGKSQPPFFKSFFIPNMGLSVHIFSCSRTVLNAVDPQLWVALHGIGVVLLARVLLHQFCRGTFFVVAFLTLIEAAERLKQRLFFIFFPLKITLRPGWMLSFQGRSHPTIMNHGARLLFGGISRQVARDVWGDLSRLYLCTEEYMQVSAFSCRLILYKAIN